MTHLRSIIDDLLDSDDEGRRESARARLRVAVTEDLALKIEARGMTRAQLARKMGVSRSAVTQALTDSRNLTLNALADMAEALDLDVLVHLVDRNAPAAVLREAPSAATQTLRFEIGTRHNGVVRADSLAQSLLIVPTGSH